MGQQPFIPEDSLQVLVPSGHCCASSGEKTLLEMPMKPFLMNSLSTSSEDFLQQEYLIKYTRQHRLLSGHRVWSSGHKICNKD